MLIDTHAHLTDVSFDADRAETLKRAEGTQVGIIIEIACDPADWQPTKIFADTNKNIYTAYGIHPSYTEKLNDENMAALPSYLNLPKAVAVGETGLDYHWDPIHKKLQREYFAKHLDLAIELNKPVIMHCRSAYDDLIKILTDYHDKGRLSRGVVHCFSGTPEEAHKITELGFLLGICAPVTYPKSDKLKQTVLETDISKLLIETDSPYLPPQNYRG
ncbi:MAG: TatD family hydrolase, partial [Elusimicrobia bacterium]|nr:TatD family hydrolase [Elusimicrobiota bacterium]